MEFVSVPNDVVEEKPRNSIIELQSMVGVKHLVVTCRFDRYRPRY